MGCRCRCSRHASQRWCREVCSSLAIGQVVTIVNDVDAATAAASATDDDDDDDDDNGGASAVKEPGHFEVRKSSSQVTRMHFVSQKSWRPF